MLPIFPVAQWAMLDSARLFLLSAHDALNTGLAKVGFHYGVKEEVTPQFGVREPWQVRDDLKWGFEADKIRPTYGSICGIASDG